MHRYEICFHPGWWHKNAGIDFSQPFWDDPDVRMDADVRMRGELFRRFGAYGLGEANPQMRPLVGSDLTACGYLFSELLGCKISYAKDNSPQVSCLNLDEDACGSLTVPDFDKSEVWQRVQKQLDDLKARFGYVQSHINLQGVQNIAMDLRGQDLFLDYFDGEDWVYHLLDVVTETMLEAGKRLRAYTPYLSGGVTNIVNHVCPEVFLTSNCSVEMVSQATYEEVLLEYDRRLAEAFPPFGIHHCGQTMEHVIKGYAKVPNLAFVEVGAYSNLAEVIDALPKDTLINARYSPVRLMQVSEDDLRKELEEMVAILPERRLSISCVGIDASVDEGQINMFLEHCRRLLPD